MVEDIPDETIEFCEVIVQRITAKFWLLACFSDVSNIVLNVLNMHSFLRK